MSPASNAAANNPLEGSTATVPTGAAAAVAAAIANVATTTTNTAAVSLAKSNNSSMLSSDPDLAATMALVAFLRAEADAADKKAKSFRKQAEQLALKFGINENVQQRYEINPDQLPPLDENGVPKYRGLKRGRKPKQKIRKANPNRTKRRHTGYTFFMHDQYPKIKAMHPTGYPSKDIISTVANEWKSFSPLLKAEWKQKAIAAHQLEQQQEQQEQRAGAASAAAVASNKASNNDPEDEEEEDEEQEDAIEEEENDDDDNDEEELDEDETEMDTTPSADEDDADNGDEEAPPARRKRIK